MKVKGLQEAMGYQGDLNPNCLFCRWIRAGKAVETFGTVAALSRMHASSAGTSQMYRAGSRISSCIKC